MVTLDQLGQLATEAIPTSGASGTVESVNISAPAMFDVTGGPITTTGTIDLALVSQATKTFFAAPDNASGVPTFRQITQADLSHLPLDFHAQNTDTHTNALAFTIADGTPTQTVKFQTGASNTLTLEDGSGARANLAVANLDISGEVTGTIFEVSVEEIKLDDNTIELNSNYTGSTPTENAGIEVQRGTLSNAQFLWNETDDRWEIGTVAARHYIGRVAEFAVINADLTAGILDLVHGFNDARVSIQAYDSADKPYHIGFSIIDANTVRADFSDLAPLTGTWHVKIRE
jgi:hypothetical protein